MCGRRGGGVTQQGVAACGPQAEGQRREPGFLRGRPGSGTRELNRPGHFLDLQINTVGRVLRRPSHRWENRGLGMPSLGSPPPKEGESQRRVDSPTLALGPWLCPVRVLSTGSGREAQVALLF